MAFVLLVALVVIAEIGQSGQKEIDGRIALSQQRQMLLAELLRSCRMPKPASAAFC